MPKSYRIRTEVGIDKYINVNLEQDWESLEILSLKILSNDIYTRFCADYGIVTGRVFVNNGFGLPNAKVSVFIPLEPTDELDPVITELYPFKTISDTTEEGYRYNLLPKLPSYNGHTSTGSFPNKGDVLMDGSYIEVFNKYYRFTVTTNDSGDFMIFGVPVGTQTIVMDIDLSDIGCFSLSPQDLIQQGLATETQVNGARFKSSTNLRELPQIKNLVFDVDVRPFWGDADLCQIGITRVDFDLTKQANINIQPTSIFMGSIISTTDDDALKVGCKPKNNTGNLCELVSGPGEISAIRQTIFSDNNGLPILEKYEIEEGGKVIDGDGTYLLNVPMNMDYVFTNEFGQQIISNDPKKGIPTTGKYRFKFRWQNEQGLQSSFLKADFLVPNVKEYGWTSSGVDPFTNYQSSVYNYPTIPIGQTSGTTVPFFNNFGLAILNTINVESYQILINGQPYTGTLNSIPILVGDTLEIIATPVDSTQVQDISFTQYPQPLFQLYRSYAFTTDWDDYVNVTEAINCEDTFYAFGYNKVYTTAMFLDRYKNGIGRARHLGIKEIDNRSCKSNTNTFPVNDIIRNFDFIFFVFNILINILTFPILTLLFVAHLIAFMWPILKYLLIVLGIFLTYDAVVSGLEAIQTGLAAINDSLGVLSVGLGVVINAGLLGEMIRNILWGIAQIAIAAFKIALAAAFTAFAVLAAIKVKGFPRIGLPMIAYPDCTSCDCDCGNAELDDNFDTNSVQNEVTAAAQAGSSSFYDMTLIPANSVIAPINSAGSYELTHPNLNKDSNNDEPFQCGSTGPYKSLGTLIGDQDINQDLAIQASLDYRRIVSGYDVLSSTNPNRLYQNEKYLLHAPQPFLWSADKDPGNVNKDDRYFAYPLDPTFPQRLNDFNLRNKYFNSGGAVNQIETTINQTSGSTPFLDQVVVVLMNPGTSSQIGVGNLCSFQDPNFTDPLSPNRLINLTGATLNQFGTNSITGTTLTGQTTVYINYANPSAPNSNMPAVPVVLNLPQVSQLSVSGNSSVEQAYLQYPTDVEYFQLITGLTVSNFLTLQNTTATSAYFPSGYLSYDIRYWRPDCPVTPVGNTTQSNFNIKTISNVITKINEYQGLEVCIFVRGVDAFTQKQTVKYDLSKIFGYTSLNNSVSIEGSYYINQPIQGYSTFSSGNKPVSHVSANNNVSNLYFPSFTFTPDVPSFSAFTSTLPYFYLCTDDTLLSGIGGYNPLGSPPPSNWKTSSQLTVGGNLTNLSNGTNNTFPLSVGAYVGGSAFLAWNLNQLTFKKIIKTDNANTNTTNCPGGCNQNCQEKEYYNNCQGWFNNPSVGGNLSALYSPAYYRYGLTGVQFQHTNLVMRSDRLPTSTKIENGVESHTGYGLHQNNNFAIYAANGTQSEPTISAGGDLLSGDSYDEDPITFGLTETLTCEGMVPLECYSGSGSNVGILPAGSCSVPANRMINGCYCLLNKTYLAQFDDDARLFLEWKVRFTMNFAACRGVFAQTFQNNWINGVLYMFSFNKRTTLGLLQEPTYNYCKDVIVFNELRNIFFYRSSPWNGVTQNFIGKNSPTISPLIPASIANDFPGTGYNKKQIQFPTTVVDLGPRDSFIGEICCSAGENGFGSYYSDQIKSTSYQDNSDIVQLGFLSRILNEGVRQRIIPITTGGNSSEGKGIVQFFNSTRGGYRIDGDWSQMLSINSEWKVLPFITENIPSSQYIYFGDNQNGIPNSIQPDDIKPIMGLFFTASTPEIRYRKIMSPGIETYNFSPLLEQKFGYPKSQNVPHYRWSITLPTTYAGTANIFGSEDNNWYTDAIPGQGFFMKKYQDLDFTTSNEKYRTNLTQVGYLASFDINGDPLPITIPAPATGAPGSSPIVVGAPYHFYFGLNNGKTAINRFYKLYVPTVE
jgi:hypothetical protein